MHILDESSNQSLEINDDPFEDDVIEEQDNFAPRSANDAPEPTTISNGQPLTAKFWASENIREFGWYQLITSTFFDLLNRRIAITISIP